MVEPFKECPRFNRCSVNNCPLHIEYPDLSICIDDKEKKCMGQKPARIKISEKYHGVLKFSGLTEKEYNLKIKRENRTPEEWEKLRQRAKKMLHTKGFST